MTIAPVSSTLRTAFFELIFGDTEGYACIAVSNPDTGKSSFKQSFFKWPAQQLQMEAFIRESSRRKNVWFCVNLLRTAKRTKDNCLPTDLVWADLDTCKPQEVDPPPPIVIESSPDRFQAIWRMEAIVDPLIAQDYSKRVAYRYNTNGVDKSGWDLTQLLRVPFTYNWKYRLPNIPNQAPQVDLVQGLEVRIPNEVFELIPVGVYKEDPTPEVDLPNTDKLPDASTIVYKYFTNLKNTQFMPLYETEPSESDDWSKILWRLINICFEAGMSNEEVFIVASEAKCNKYARDNRAPRYLWVEVLKAEGVQNRINVITASFRPLAMPEIVTAQEADALPRTFVDDYKDWACAATDAVPEYHELSAFMLLSATCASALSLETSYGKVVPNLWGLILGDSTLTRKTTAMRMAMEFLGEIDKELVLATDGSAEGLLTGLAGRPNRVSIYFKDEVTGFLDSINRKDYLAGMPETLTQLYDVPSFFTRRLRKEVISITNPVFIFFGGGIRDKVYSLITDEYILSGFLPRFLVVSGEADLSRIRRTGPAEVSITASREAIKEKIADLFEIYNQPMMLQVAGQEISTNRVVECFLTKDAWQRYGDIEAEMVARAHESPLSMLALPSFERLSRSLLKMAMLLASARDTVSEGTIQATEADILCAAKYIQDWGRYTVDLISNANKTVNERALEKVLRAIERHPGVARSTLMQHYKLTKREADDILGTLEDRGTIRNVREGRGHRYWANT